MRPCLKNQPNQPTKQSRHKPNQNNTTTTKPHQTNKGRGRGESSHFIGLCYVDSKDSIFFFFCNRGFHSNYSKLIICRQNTHAEKINKSSKNKKKSISQSAGARFKQGVESQAWRTRHGESGMVASFSTGEAKTGGSLSNKNSYNKQTNKQKLRKVA